MSSLSIVAAIMYEGWINRLNNMQRQQNDKKQNTSQLWGATSELRDYFKPLNPAAYNSAEIRYLQDQYECVTHPASGLIINLLNSVSAFLNATTLEPQFKTSRDKSKSKKELQEDLDNMANAIKQIEMQRDSTHDPSTSVILATAADYVAECVNRRLHALKAAHDQIHDLFLHGHPELGNILKQHPSSSMQKK